MANRGYVIAGVEFLAAAVLIFVPGGQPLAAALAISAAATFAGTALQASPPRIQNMRDSPNYGIDKFNNPRGPEAFIPIIYGTHRVKPAVILESVREAKEGVSPGDIANTAQQEFRWLGAVGEGVLASALDVEIDDRKALSDRREEELGKGNSSNKEFKFPHAWVYIGPDDAPDVQVYVAGVLQTWALKSATDRFTMPTGTAKTLDVKRDDHDERIVLSSIRVFVSGPGRPETEQLRREGTFQWTAQKLKRWKVRLRFRVRPPSGYTVRVTYSYLGGNGVAVVQNPDGATKAIFKVPPVNGAKVTAKYSIANFHGLLIDFRPGDIDQQPIDGFGDLEQSRNPPQSLLTKNQAIVYTTDGREVDNLRVGINAPRGLVQWTTTGGTVAVTVEIRIEYRKAGAASWTTLRSSGGQTFKLIGQRSSTMRFEVDFLDELERLALAGDKTAADAADAFDRAAYEVRVTRIDKQSSDPLVANELEWTYVTEVLRQGFSYPGTSLLALRGRVGAAIAAASGLRVTCVATRAPLADPRTDPHGDARDLGSSQNTALAIRDLLTSAGGEAVERYGGGAFFTDEDIFFGTDGTPAEVNGLIAFADWCDEWVHRPGDNPDVAPSSTNGERRVRLNIVLDTPESLAEAVADMAVLARCFACAQGARWRFPLDVQADPVFEFVDDVDPANQNMDDFILQQDEWGATPTELEGSFWNEELHYERDQLVNPVDGLPADTPPNAKSIDMRGITRGTEAARLLRHLAEQAHGQPFKCTWRGHPGAQLVEAGDIVTCKTHVPYSTGGSAVTFSVRVLAVVAGRDEEGRHGTKYAGRVVNADVYTLEAVTVPKSHKSFTPKAAAQSGRKVTVVRARVVKR